MVRMCEMCWAHTSTETQKTIVDRNNSHLVVPVMSNRSKLSGPFKRTVICSSFSRQLLIACLLISMLGAYVLLFRATSNHEAPLSEDVPNLTRNGFTNKIHHKLLPKNLLNRKLNFDQVYEPRLVSFNNYRYSDASNPEIATDVKVILLWTSWNGLWETINYYFLRPGNESFVAFHCPNQKCYVTKDEQYLERADVVLFHLLDIDRRGKFPKFRRSDQRWILYIMEAPWQVDVEMGKLRSLFNWTMSFRDDSDIVVKYGFSGRRPQPLPATTELLEKGSLSKKKSAVWFVSDCKTESRREDYVRELGRHIDMDVYGLCGPKKCFPSQSDDCYNRVLKDYKFYLSFENSICRDYATEKFFNILSYGIVPVVFGGANYSQIAPPGSYIDATAFPNPRDLAVYLRTVGGNETLYRSFLNWKLDYAAYLQPWMCNLCDKVHEPVVHSVRDDVKKWWMTDSSCKRWSDKGNFEDVIR